MMDETQQPGGTPSNRREADQSLVDFLDRQLTRLSESTRIDEWLGGELWEEDPEQVARGADAARLRAQAEADLTAYLRALATAPQLPRFALVGVSAAAFAQCALGAIDEDDRLAVAVSWALEQFVARSAPGHIRDQVDALLNLAHRRAALVGAVRWHAEVDEAAPESAPPAAGGADTPRDLFGFPGL